MSSARTVCERCAGRGWIVVADGGAGSASPCSCRAETTIAARLVQAGIPERYRRCSFGSFQVDIEGFKDQLLEARELARRYVDGFIEPDGRFREGGLLFVGPPGVGKTHLAAAVLAALVERYGVTGRFVDFTHLVYEIQSSFGANSEVTTSGLLRPIVEAQVLVLDELGARKPSPWVSDILYLILNARYTARRATLFTSNYRLPSPGSDAPPAKDELSTRIARRLVSRLFEMTLPISIESIDFRQVVMAHRQRL